jgi:hypothetical protein
MRRGAAAALAGAAAAGWGAAALDAPPRGEVLRVSGAGGTELHAEVFGPHGAPALLLLRRRFGGGFGGNGSGGMTGTWVRPIGVRKTCGRKNMPATVA